jgi:hypothetical protein
MSGNFIVTRRDRYGRPYEANVATIQGPTMPGNRSKDEAAARVRGAMPDLLRQLDLHIAKLESKMPEETSMHRNYAVKELERFRRRRALLSHGIIACGASDGLDIVWTQWTDPLIYDARIAGMLADDSTPTPSGTGSIAAVPDAGLMGQFKQLAAAVRRLEYQAKMQAATRDRNRAADLADKANICYYVAAHLDNGNLPTNPHIDRLIDLTSLTLPLYPAAIAEGRLITVDHDDNIRWVQQHRGGK